jgi:transcriptional regulator with XRE-family HTH domain
MDVNKIIESRRKDLGLSDRQVAEAIGTNLHSYCDIEWHADELCRAVPLSQIKKLSEILVMDLFELLAVHCSFCVDATAYVDAYRLPRDELIKFARQNAGLSQKQLAERAEFYDAGIVGMESDPHFLDESTVESVQDLAAILNIPFQILAGWKCPRCGR